MNPIIDVEAAARAGWRPLDVARAFFDGGAAFVQLRAKSMASGALVALASQIVAVGRSHGAKVIVNDRADVAKLVDADGVHLGQEDLPPQAARSLLGTAAVIGRSTHTSAQLEATATEPIDYVAMGPVFGTTTKATGYEAVGLAMVERAARTGRPVVAIGGITLENAASVIVAGAASVAVISDLLASGDPAGRVRAYNALLERI